MPGFTALLVLRGAAPRVGHKLFELREVAAALAAAQIPELVHVVSLAGSRLAHVPTLGWCLLRQLEHLLQKTRREKSGAAWLNQ